MVLELFRDLYLSATSSIHSLHLFSLLPTESKILLISSEAGSITLRRPKEGGGYHAHDASQATLIMVGKLFSLNLKEHGAVIGIMHPGFMRTEIMAGMGCDRY
ncbi:uncharacterized protein RCO7_15159 [Rhynchosporium graminicola]|uniref:Uncharacterized protein n=1 Tax=Rhynchosporium graminicola TaxID=2792576 RepID=A0A1E1LN48_9HELO|nr:uncharacterized protein RCO7_15159 [Rhynchosporium commune]